VRNGREAASVNAAERAGYGDLDLLGRRLSAIYPDVGDFAAHAMAEIDRLRKRLVFSELPPSAWRRPLPQRAGTSTGKRCCFGSKRNSWLRRMHS